MSNTPADLEAELLTAQADALRLLDDKALAEFEKRTRSASARVLAVVERARRTSAA